MLQILDEGLPPQLQSHLSTCSESTFCSRDIRKMMGCSLKVHQKIQTDVFCRKLC